MSAGNTKTITFTEEELELIDQALSFTFQDQYEKSKKFKLLNFDKQGRRTKAYRYSKLNDKIFDAPYDNEEQE